MSSRSLGEESFNVTLAGLLAERGLKALGEIFRRDVMLELNGVRIIIEGKKPGNRRELFNQAKERVENGECDICAMVEYADIKIGELQLTQKLPIQVDVNQEDVKEALLNGRFNIAFMTLPEVAGLERWFESGRTEVTEFHEVDFHDLITYLMSAYEKTVSKDALSPVIEKLEGEIREFGRNVLLSGDVNIQRLKEVLELREEEVFMSRREDEKILGTAGVILTDAMVFHEVIAGRIAGITTISRLKDRQNVKKALENEWKKILDENYEPVFRIALEILKNLPASLALNNGLKRLLDMAYNIVSSRVLLRQDLMGRIYHQLLLGKLAKYYAALYTSIPAARLLARLLITLPSPLSCENIPPKYGKDNLKVVDFAIGSGTLASALKKELDAKHRTESKKPDPEGLHKYLVEDGFWGFDVLQHAAHLASTTLALHEPSSEVEKSRIYSLPLGKFGSRKYLGSIDFLRSPLISEAKLCSGGIGAERLSVTEKEEAGGEKLPGFHLCIMNPPFTRSVGGNLLFGDLPESKRKELQKELSKLMKDMHLSGIVKGGLGAVFVNLADRYLKGGGRLALVLPKTVLSGVSWKKVRELLLDNYYIEFIISSFQGGDEWNFSENTSLSEVLLIARKLSDKKSKTQTQGYTTFVNLFRKPESEIESIHIASQLKNFHKSPALDIENANASSFPVKSGGKEIARVYSAELKEPWFCHYTLFAQPELNRTASLLRNGTLYLPEKGIIGRIPLSNLKDFAVEVGPDRRQVHNAFSKRGYRSRETYQTLWSHDPNNIRSLEQKPNASLDPKNSKKARDLWEKRGKLLIIERGRLSTYRVLAVSMTKDVLSNVWWPIQTNDLSLDDDALNADEVAEILALWTNSTYGMLLLLSVSEITQGPWLELKKGPIENLPVLDIRRFGVEQAKKLLDLYSEIKYKEFKPLPKSFEDPGIRREVDEKLNKILSINAKLDSLYKLLSKDPTITGKMMV